MTDPSARLLAAQCLFELGHLDHCLALLGDDADLGHAISSLSLTPEKREVSAALCVLRARVYERVDNSTRAVIWYKRALRCDIWCVEAFVALCSAGFIPSDNVLDFVNEIAPNNTDPSSGPAESEEALSQIQPATDWISAYYRCATDRTAPVPQLGDNADVRAILARRQYDDLDFVRCANLCRDLLREDPYADDPILLTYLAALVELDERHELFVTAHTLVERAPKRAISWLGVGYYYLACGKPDVARRFLQKATRIDARLAQAWVAFGHAFAMQDESDQALASYRTAARLFPGAHLPLLFMGMENARQSSVTMACMLFQRSLNACPADPAPRHMLGVLAFRSDDLPSAVAYFKAALSLWEAADGRREVSACTGRRAEAEEATLVNLGHCYRRLKLFSRAKSCYERALGLRPRSCGTCVALGITLHAMWDVSAAVNMYHRALRNSPDDAVCSQLLERALMDLFICHPGSSKAANEILQQQQKQQTIIPTTTSITTTAVTD